MGNGYAAEVSPRVRSTPQAGVRQCASLPPVHRSPRLGLAYPVLGSLSSVRLTGMLDAVLTLITGLVPLTSFVLDGHCDKHNAVQMAR
jgi:hypothetical protein